jgi:hypothetical protein
MNRLTKIVVAIALVAMSMTAIAGEVTVKGIHGTWWNPAYDGEGFVLEQYDDGTFVAYMYTYHNVIGWQRWFVGAGGVSDSVNDRIEIVMYETDGGGMGSTSNPVDVNREEYGLLTLDLISCDIIEMELMSSDGWQDRTSYTLQRLLPHGGLTNAFCEDEYDPTAVEEASFKHYHNSWMGLSEIGPLVGTMTMETQVIGEDAVLVYALALEAIDGDLTISKVSAVDSTGNVQPGISLSKGQVIEEGTTWAYTLTSPLTNGKTVELHYLVEIEGLGEAVDFFVTLTTN